MQEFLANFHFLRPWWLLAVLPAVLLMAALWRSNGRASYWQQLIAPQLLRFLLDSQPSRGSRWPLCGLLTAWLLGVVALAGPTWERLPEPVQKLETGVVILWDMSPSMHAEDVKPSRLLRSRYKLIDFLNERREGITGLVAYAGEAHVISPLTDDTNTIINLLPALEPAIMPLPGSNIEMAVELGAQLLRDAGLQEGSLLVVTDGIELEAHASLMQQLRGARYRLSILGVGTDDGAPIPTGSGGFAKDDNGIVIAKLGSSGLRQLAARLGGVYVNLRPDSGDVERLLEAADRVAEDELRARQVNREFDTWRDAGQYLALLLIPFAALAFRRGWVLGLLVCCGLGTGYAPPTQAADWDDLWLRGDQQGQRSLAAGDAAQAAQEFKRPDWQGTALYRNHDYEAAAERFSHLDHATAHYNRGNALAKAGDFEAAISAYDTALEQDPDLEDARYNRDLIQRLLDQRQRQQGQQQSGDPQQNEQGQEPRAQSDAARQQSASGNNDGQSSTAAADSEAANTEPQQTTNSAQDGGDDRQTMTQATEEMQSQSPPDAEPREQGTRGDLKQADGESRPNDLEPDQMANSESQQALEQWLRQIPDDPSGLLRRKLQYQHQQLRQSYRAGQWQPPENEAYKRW